MVIEFGPHLYARAIAKANSTASYLGTTVLGSARASRAGDGAIAMVNFSTVHGYGCIPHHGVFAARTWQTAREARALLRIELVGRVHVLPGSMRLSQVAFRECAS